MNIEKQEEDMRQRLAETIATKLIELAKLAKLLMPATATIMALQSTSACRPGRRSHAELVERVMLHPSMTGLIGSTTDLIESN